MNINRLAHCQRKYQKYILAREKTANSRFATLAYFKTFTPRAHCQHPAAVLAPPSWPMPLPGWQVPQPSRWPPAPSAPTISPACAIGRAGKPAPTAPCWPPARPQNSSPACATRRSRLRPPPQGRISRQGRRSLQYTWRQALASAAARWAQRHRPQPVCLARGGHQHLHPPWPAGPLLPPPGRRGHGRSSLHGAGKTRTLAGKPPAVRLGGLMPGPPRIRLQPGQTAHHKPPA